MRSLLLRVAVPSPSLLLGASLSLALGCTKPDDQAPQPPAPSAPAQPTAVPGAFPAASAATRGATALALARTILARDAGSAVAAKKGLPSCPAGTTLAWADNDSAKCLRPCDGTDANCPKGSSCTPGNAVGDDGNPIPHDIVDVCLPSAAPSAAAGSPDAGAAASAAGKAMEVPNPSGATCPAGYGDQGLLATCNKSCKSTKECTPPFTCESLGSDPPHNCVDLKHLHMQGAPP